MRDPAGLKFDEERLVDGDCWVDHSGQWQQFPPPCFRSAVGTTSGYFRDPRGLLDELKSAGHTVYVGRSNGVDTWTFTSTDVRDTVTLSYSGTVTVDVATSHVLSVAFTESIPGQTTSSTIAVSYHDYGVPVIVTAP